MSLDGRTDVAGQTLHDLTSPSLGFASAGISPDGLLVAYAPPSLTIVDLTSQRADIVMQRTVPDRIVWSADSSQLALDLGLGDMAVAGARDGSLHAVAGTPPNAVGDLIGWIDSSHLAVTYIGGQTIVSNPNNSQDQYATSIAVASLSTETGQTHVIATIHSPGLGQWSFSLAPDGRTILFSNRQYRSYPYTPQVDEIDVASGTVTPLPHIDQITQSGFTAVAWQRGTGLLAVSSGFIVNGDLKDWILNPGQDSAVALPNVGYVASWAPAGSTVVVTTGQQTENGTGPFTLTALSIGPSGQVVSSTVLTNAAMTFPFLGFIRTG